MYCIAQGPIVPMQQALMLPWLAPLQEHIAWMLGWHRKASALRASSAHPSHGRKSALPDKTVLRLLIAAKPLSALQVCNLYSIGLDWISSLCNIMMRSVSALLFFSFFVWQDISARMVLPQRSVT